MVRFGGISNLIDLTMSILARTLLAKYEPWLNQTHLICLKRFEKIRYGTIIPLALVGYDLAIIISYSMSVSGMIVVLKRPQNIEN